MIQTVCDGCGKPIQTYAYLRLEQAGERVVSVARLHDATEWDFHDLSCLGDWTNRRIDQGSSHGL